MSLLQSLECTACGKKYDANQLIKLCDCGKVLYPRYDLELAKETLNTDLSGRPNNIWRMHEIMPCSKEYQFTLGEGGTPLLEMHDLKGINVFMKDEGLNPTGSFKARGLCAAVSRGIELGVKEFIIPTAGNAGAALAAYCARTGTKAHIYTPKDAPEMIIKEFEAYGAEITLVDGLITDAGKMVREVCESKSWFDVSTLKEPYRVEVKKTMGLELAEQMNWELPDVIIYPTGGGTGIVGMMKAFDELETLGMVGTDRPRMVSVQASGCAPIVRAFDNKEKHATMWQDADTLAAGLRVPAAIGDYLILDAIYSTGGCAIAVEDTEIIDTMKILAKQEGVFMASEAAATYVGLVKLVNQGWIDRGENVCLFGTGSGFTTPELW